MGNRLEQEFPHVAWQAMPPIGPRGIPPELIRNRLECGRQLRNQAIRNGLRAGGTAVLGVLVSVAAFIRCAASPKRHPGRDCWTAWTHRV
jgi:hypothetical protein